jgi:carbon monoxide dehydrogenase subunit G
MPEVEYTTKSALRREVIWAFVKDIDNWAPFLTGYQRHDVLSATDSIWTLKGDVGVLARVVKLKAHVTEWNGPTRVSFTLTGLNEPIDGEGTIEMSASGGDDKLVAPGAARRSRLARLVGAIVRFLLRRMNQSVPARAVPQTGAASQLTFRLRMEAGGPMGALVNAMLSPALLPAAEDLANKIVAHIERTNGSA